MTPNEVTQEILKCLKKPLERSNLPWAREEIQSLPIRNPIRILLDYTDNVVVQVDMETLSNDSETTWKTLGNIEKELQKKYGNVTTRYYHNFKFFEFKVV